jgi:hypothetical protein
MGVERAQSLRAAMDLGPAGAVIACGVTLICAEAGLPVLHRGRLGGGTLDGIRVPKIPGSGSRRIDHPRMAINEAGSVEVIEPLRCSTSTSSPHGTPWRRFATAPCLK